MTRRGQRPRRVPIPALDTSTSALKNRSAWASAVAMMTVALVTAMMIHRTIMASRKLLPRVRLFFLLTDALFFLLAIFCYPTDIFFLDLALVQLSASPCRKKNP